MTPAMFPKMLVSHEQGWDWLDRSQPTVARIYLLYAVPLSVIPPAMLFYAWHAYDHKLINVFSLQQVLLLCLGFFIVELVMVPLMASIIRRLGDISDTVIEYRRAFILASVAPTPLWITPLFLFIPSPLLNALALAVALFASGVLIFQGVPRICHIDDEGKSVLLAGSVIAAGLVAWVGMILLTFVSFGVMSA